MLDPISDMLTRIRNAQKAGKLEVFIPFSNLKMSIAEILKNNNYLENVSREKIGKVPYIKVILKYNASLGKKFPAISDISRISRQGKRVYVGKDKIRKVKQGYGISIISTSKGVMTGSEAKKEKIGGELICEVW